MISELRDHIANIKIGTCNLCSVCLSLHQNPKIKRTAKMVRKHSTSIHAVNTCLNELLTNSAILISLGRAFWIISLKSLLKAHNSVHRHLDEKKNQNCKQDTVLTTFCHR